jgi:hypothetical protein
MGGINSNRLHSIQVVLDATDVRAWHKLLIARLKAAGHAVGVQLIHQGKSNNPLEAVLRLEQLRLGPSLASSVAAPTQEILACPDLLIDLVGNINKSDVPALRLKFNGHSRLADGIADLLAANRSPVVSACLDGIGVGVARPMVSDRLWLSRLCDQLLAGALSLLEQTLARFSHNALTPVDLPEPTTTPEFWRSYLGSFSNQLLQRGVNKLRQSRPFHWQVAYRQVEEGDWLGIGTGGDTPFIPLPDDGQRFYADPFVLEQDGRTYLFVEEYPYALGRGVISVAELGSDGRFAVPRIVLKEPHHLSYPQVFKHNGDIFMLPESGGAGQLVLYRAAAFPDQWVVDTILLQHVDINDATLLQHGGLFWLCGTERRNRGSASDTLVVYSAPALRGPWTPHKLNPIAIDRSAARPGGAFIMRNERIFLPVQDGQKVYGGGLGLMELLRLNQDEVVFAPPAPINPAPAWDRAGIHTLNRTSGIEVVDSCA